MSFSKEEFAEFANNAQKLWNSCILTIKNIEETNKKKNNFLILCLIITKDNKIFQKH